MYNLFFDRILHSIDVVDAPFAFLADGSRENYSDLLDWSGRYANALVEIGLRPGDFAVCSLSADIHQIYFYLATLRVGGIFVPVSGAGSHEQFYALAGSGDQRTIIVSDAQYVDKIGISRGSGAAVLQRKVHCTKSQLLDLASRCSGQFQDAVRVPDDLAICFLESGLTTFTHQQLASSADRIVCLLRLTSSDRMLQAVPISDPQGFIMAGNLVLLSNGSMLLSESFTGLAGEVALRTATYVAGNCDYYDDLMTSNALGHDNVRGIRVFLAGHTTLSSLTQKKFQMMTGRSILPNFGLSTALACA